MYESLMVAEVRDWLHRLRQTDLATLMAISDAHNLKELRPGASGSAEVRILFVFDPRRRAVLLVAADKAGQWKRWYNEAIPLAEQRYATYLKEAGL